MNENPRTKSKFGISNILIIILIFFAGFGLGSQETLSASSDLSSVAGKFGDLVGTPAEGLDLNPLWQAWSLLETKFVASAVEPTAIEKVRGLIDGLTDSYGDPYTEYFTPEELVRFNETLEGGSFSGVGMEIGLSKDGLLRVVSPLKNTPAEAAGLRPDDIILQIDDTKSLDISIDEALSLIRGPEGTEVTLTIAREGKRQPIIVSITRQNIDIPILTTKVQDDVFVISIYSFSEDLNSVFQDALVEYEDSGASGLIIDLRNNPGGYLNSAVELGSWFVSAGEVLVRERSERAGDEDRLYRSKGYQADILNKQPVVFMVNKGSASASEILAGAIQDYEIATVVGETTFGKGSVQELVPLSDGSAIKITTAKWLTPDGLSISDGGLEPDVSISDDPETELIDEQLEAALSIVK
jgi:carboxyl-terminal processing protease